MQFIFSLKNKIIIFLAIILAILFLPQISLAATINAASCEQADVQAAINQAVDGDTVMVPAGSCTWNSNSCISAGNYCAPVYINKSIILQGAGADQTIINDSTDIAWNKPALYIGCSAATYVRITQFSFTGQNGGEAFIKIGGCSKGFRVDHNKFLTSAGRGIMTLGNTTGLIDNNTFLNPSDEYIDIEGSNSQSWQEDFSSVFGTKNAVFVENNYWSYDSAFTENGANALDSNQGARWVFRHNKVDSWRNSQPIELHGWMLAGAGVAGTRSFEIYNNEFNILDSSYTAWNAIRIRGGEGVIFNNAFTGKWGSLEIRLDEERARMSVSTVPPNCMYVDPTNPSTWEMPDRPCLYQIHNLFIWDNIATHPPFDIGIQFPELALYIVKDRDYFLRAPSKTLDGFDYTSYIYPHPFAVAPFGTTLCGEGNITSPCWCENANYSNGYCYNGNYSVSDNILDTTPPSAPIGLAVE